MPELTCEECGKPYAPWSADNAVWNLVLGGPEATGDPGGMLCPRCFTVRAEDVYPSPVWRLSLVTAPGSPPHDEARLSRLLFESREATEMFAAVVRVRSGSQDRWLARLVADIDDYRAAHGWSADGYGGEGDAPGEDPPTDA